MSIRYVYDWPTRQDAPTARWTNLSGKAGGSGIGIAASLKERWAGRRPRGVWTMSLVPAKARL